MEQSLMGVETDRIIFYVIGWGMILMALFGLQTPVDSTAIINLAFAAGGATVIYKGTNI